MGSFGWRLVARNRDYRRARDKRGNSPQDIANMTVTADGPATHSIGASATI
jgi:hypothetical protein